VRAVIKDSPRPGIAITEVDEPTAGPGQVLIEVVAAFLIIPTIINWPGE